MNQNLSPGRLLLLGAASCAIASGISYVSVGRGILTAGFMGVAVLLWLIAVVYGFFKSFIESHVSVGAKPRLLLSGIILLLLPLGWAVLVTKLGGDPNLISSPIVLLPSFASWVIGGILILYSLVRAAISAWWQR